MKKDRPPGEPSPHRRRPPGPLWLSSLSLFVPLSELMSELEDRVLLDIRDVGGHRYNTGRGRPGEAEVRPESVRWDSG